MRPVTSYGQRRVTPSLGRWRKAPDMAGGEAWVESGMWSAYAGRCPKCGGKMYAGAYFWASHCTDCGFTGNPGVVAVLTDKGEIIQCFFNGMAAWEKIHSLLNHELKLRPHALVALEDLTR